MTGQVRRGRPRAGAEVEDEVLLRAALSAFAEHGYEGTSVREISRGLGLSDTLLIMRFGTKQQLWCAAMDQALNAWRHSFAELDPPSGDLAELWRAVRLYVEFAGRYPQVARIMAYEGAIDGPRIRYIHDRFLAPPGGMRRRCLTGWPPVASSGRSAMPPSPAGRAWRRGAVRQ